jgi:tRNA(Ile)-lysidine synthase TilS/MesJ
LPWDIPWTIRLKPLSCGFCAEADPPAFPEFPRFDHPDIIRPLIEVTRQEVEDYMARRMLKHITDPSNLERDHLRNRIRLDLLPQLKTYQPRILEILGQTAGIMRK